VHCKVNSKILGKLIRRMEADELIKNEKKVGREARSEEGDWGT